MLGFRASTTTRDKVSEASPFQAPPYLLSLLLAAHEEAWIRVQLNGSSLFLPAGTILTMAHCVRVSEDGALQLDVETAHLDWMRAKLRPGSVFLDVGSATGAMTLPIADKFPGVRIVAFEPARRARRLLKATLVKNDLFGVAVEPNVIWENEGAVSFAERPISQDGSIPFLPETSTIVSEGSTDPHGEVLKVSATTLDAVGRHYGLCGDHIVIKIDIEGFEVGALRGAEMLLDLNTVHLAIDIHQIPEGGKTTEADCRKILDAHGYSNQRMLGHVLLASK